MKKILFFVLAFTFIACKPNKEQTTSEETVFCDESISTNPDSDDTTNTIEENATESSENKEESLNKAIDVSNRFEGVYECAKTYDVYVFEEGNTGKIIVGGSSNPETFDWERDGSNVTLTFTGKSKSFGKQKLSYNEKAHCVIEESPSLGTLIFEKK